PTHDREIWTPAMISASSAALLIASIVASTLTMFPLRVPRLAAAPLPMTSSVPLAFCSPIRTQILEVPMSQATRKFSGLDIRRDGLRLVQGPRSKVQGSDGTGVEATSISGLPWTLDFGLWTFSKGVPGAVCAFEHDSIRESKIYGPCLPP